MNFAPGTTLTHELTYNDVFIEPQHNGGVESRFDTDLAPVDATGRKSDTNCGTTIPIAVSNMTNAAGPGIAEVVARRGGLVVLPQDLSDAEVADAIAKIKAADPYFDTPVTVRPDTPLSELERLLLHTAHQTALVVEDGSEDVGLFSLRDLADKTIDASTTAGSLARYDTEAMPDNLDPEEMVNWLSDHRMSAARVVGADGQTRGIITPESAVRSDIYKPALDALGKLMVGAAIGINGDVAGRARLLIELGADVLVVDTAHGDQKRCIEAVRTVQEARVAMHAGATIVAGNVVTGKATRRLLKAGADIVKVGVGPGAMCSTRLMTGVGRPQFSAVLECARAARRWSLMHPWQPARHVWADGGIKYPRDVALALAAGASMAMFGSLFAGTYESPPDVQYDADGRPYKEHHGMASRKAVRNRTQARSEFDRRKAEMFEEGVDARAYLDPERPGAEDVLDYILGGVRSAFTYVGARNARQFSRRVVVGVQSASGYQEGLPVTKKA